MSSKVIKISSRKRKWDTSMTSRASSANIVLPEIISEKENDVIEIERIYQILNKKCDAQTYANKQTKEKFNDKIKKSLAVYIRKYSEFMKEVSSLKEKPKTKKVNTCLFKHTKNNQTNKSTIDVSIDKSLCDLIPNKNSFHYMKSSRSSVSVATFRENKNKIAELPIHLVKQRNFQELQKLKYNSYLKYVNEVKQSKNKICTLRSNMLHLIDLGKISFMK